MALVALFLTAFAEVNVPEPGKSLSGNRKLLGDEGGNGGAATAGHMGSNRVAGNGRIGGSVIGGGDTLSGRSVATGGAGGNARGGRGGRGK
jgi:hypothetical protein